MQLAEEACPGMLGSILLLDETKRELEKVSGLTLEEAKDLLLKAMEDERRRMDRLALLGQMSATVAHEIRNPLLTEASRSIR